MSNTLCNIFKRYYGRQRRWDKREAMSKIAGKKMQTQKLPSVAVNNMKAERDGQTETSFVKCL